MYIVVLCVAVFVISVGLSVIILPANLKIVFSDLIVRKFLWPVSVLRLILGVAFFLAAGECRSPLFVHTVGAVFIIAGIVLPILGHGKIQKTASYFLLQPDWFWRIAGFIAMLFGIALALAGMPA